MAPSSKGVNPAPNYTVDMNRVQTQLEARLRIVRSFMPSRAPTSSSPSSSSSSSSSTATKPTPSFSALASTSTSTSKAPPPSNSNSNPSTRQRHDDEDSLFTETRAQHPNAGLGFGAPAKRSSEREKERSDQILRSRLLGRKRGAENNNKKDASGRRREVESSDDEEPGRSGLGRAKKRVRREESQEREARLGGDEEGDGEISSKVPEYELERNGARADSLRNDEAGEDEKVNNEVETRNVVQNIASPHEDSVPGGVGDASEQQKKKRRKKKKKRRKKKKKKKNKDKSKEANAE
ncbi:hypothetical protein F5Y01DRAFT_186940 [Xylaria sp. FL0043]|nr:hypothetical protein F5Y01DRAFT_186940 [Xylaria sp. FL0043]